MIKYFCDHCRAELDSKGLQYTIKRDAIIRLRGKSEIRLCDKCNKKFKQFINGKEVENE